MDTNEIVERAKKAANVSKNKQFADLLGISENNFSNMKISGTIVNHLLKWAIQEKINLSWLFYGSERPNQDQLIEDIKNLNDWMLEMTDNDKDREAWFRVELKEKFPEFKDWLDKRNKTE